MDFPSGEEKEAKREEEQKGSHGFEERKERYKKTLKSSYHQYVGRDDVVPVGTKTKNGAKNKRPVTVRRAF